MAKIIVIRHTDDIDLYFSKFSDFFSDFVIEMMFVPGKRIDKLNSLGKSKHDVIFLEYHNAELFEKNIDTLNLSDDGSLYFIYNSNTISDENMETLKNNCAENKLLGGLIDISVSIELYIPMFRDVLKHLKTDSEIIKLKDMGKQLEGLVGNTLAELQRVKNIHDQVVPMRNERIKGVQILSKYSAGDSPGGDFFDILSDKNEFVLLVTSSSSYVVSSKVLAHFEVLKEKKTLNSAMIFEFISNIEAEIIELGLEKVPDALQMLIIKFDLRRMMATGYMFGGFEVISNIGKSIIGNNYPLRSVFSSQASINIPFKRGEKIILLSPGIRYNHDIVSGEDDLTSILKQSMSKSGKDVLNELFFGLHKNIKSDFLKFDASAIFIEVSKNAIFQV